MTKKAVPAPRPPHPQPFSALLNGLSQVFLTTSPVAGCLILAGVAVASPPMASLVLIGAAITTATARASHSMPDSTITAGLAGYNGALIGAASYATWGEYPPALAATVVGAFAGAAITTLCAWVLQRRGIREFALPVLTAPFCITSGIMALLGARYVPTAPVAPLPAASPWAAGLKAVLGNISEVILVDRPLTGLLILAGLTIAAWRVGLAALLGAVGEFLIDLATGQDTNKLLHGLLGYSGVLVTIALGVVFVSGSWQRRTLAAAAGLAVSQAVATALAQTPVPAYTWPFIVPTWLILIALALWDRRRRHSSAQRPWPAGPATAAIRP